MSESYKGLTVPMYSDAADGPGAFRQLVDSGPIPRFATAAARDAAITSPVKGQVIYRTDLGTTGGLELWGGTSWGPIVPATVPAHNHPGTAITSDIPVSMVPNLPATIITSGTLAAARLPAATTSAVGGVRLGDASNEAAPGNHNHDGRYYTEAEVVSLVSSRVPFVSGPGLTGLVHGKWGFDGQVYIAYLEVAGQSVPSSLAYKTDIRPIDLSKALFERLSPIHFHWKEGHAMEGRAGTENPPEGRMGFVYEEVAEFAPDFAYGETRGVNYVGMLPDFMAWTVAAIRDLRKKLSAHENATLA